MRSTIIQISTFSINGLGKYLYSEYAFLILSPPPVSSQAVVVGGGGGKRKSDADYS
jgi:uncharacterized SAM-binding protein YcdF (DUF218 family)